MTVLDDRVVAIGEGLRSYGEAPPGAKESAEAAATSPLPVDYLTFAGAFDGAEGWIGSSYVALWRLSEIPGFMETLETELNAPGFFPIGTDGAGEAFGIDLRPGQSHGIVMLPLIGMSWEYAEALAETFSDWLIELAGSKGSRGPRDPGSLRMNVYEVHPVMFGGDPKDRANKRLVPLSDVIRLSRWWNDQLPKAGG